MSERKERPRGAARAGILESATRLFVEKGIDKTSLSDIARDVGISKGTLHYHFASKHDLIFAITETHVDRITAELRLFLDGMEADTTTLFTQLLEAFLSATTRGRLHLHVVREAVSGNESLRKQVTISYEGWQKEMERALLRVFPDHPAPETISRLLIAAIDGFIIQSLVTEEPIPVASLARTLIDLNRMLVK